MAIRSTLTARRVERPSNEGARDCSGSFVLSCGRARGRSCSAAVLPERTLAATASLRAEVTLPPVIGSHMIEGDKIRIRFTHVGKGLAPAQSKQLQGFIIAYLDVPAFIVTLGGLLIWRGAAWWITSGQTIAPLETLRENRRA